MAPAGVNPWSWATPRRCFYWCGLCSLSSAARAPSSSLGSRPLLGEALWNASAASCVSGATGIIHEGTSVLGTSVRQAKIRANGIQNGNTLGPPSTVLDWILLSINVGDHGARARARVPLRGLGSSRARGKLCGNTSELRGVWKGDVRTHVAWP